MQVCEVMIVMLNKLLLGCSILLFYEKVFATFLQCLTSQFMCLCAKLIDLVKESIY